MIEIKVLNLDGSDESDQRITKCLILLIEKMPNATYTLDM